MLIRVGYTTKIIDLYYLVCSGLRWWIMWGGKDQNEDPKTDQNEEPKTTWDSRLVIFSLFLLIAFVCIVRRLINAC